MTLDEKAKLILQPTPNTVKCTWPKTPGEVKKSSDLSQASWPWDAQVVCFQVEAVDLVINRSSQN